MKYHSFNRLRMGAIFLLTILTLLGSGRRALALCAQVKIQIDQEMAFERQAFEARMVIDNALPDTPLTDFAVTLKFLDKNKLAVTGTDNPQYSGTDAQFFYQRIVPTTMPTAIASGSTQSIKWQIIPSQGAGGTDPAGTVYWVGGTVSYKINGTPETIELDPASITVRPMPKIAIEYFLPKQVLGDDPYTTGTVEDPIPAPLAVRVVNIGAGMARSLSIESGQVQIVENLRNLAIQFQIVSSEVNGQPAARTLLANFGDIGPKQIGMGLWNLSVSITGRFSKFDVTMTHADELGGKVTSLLKDPVPYYLLGTVRVDLPGRDNIVDYLAWTGTTGGPISIHESDQIEPQDQSGNLIPTPVTNLSTPSSLSETALSGSSGSNSPAGATGGKLSVGCAVSGSSFGFIQVTDPFAGKRTVLKVMRSDGKVLPAQNAWFSKEQAITNEDHSWTYSLNLFDSFTSGFAPNALSYTFVFGVPVVNHPPVIAPMGTLFLKVSGSSGTAPYQFTVRATDADNDPITLSGTGLPIGMSFTDNKDGTGLLSWAPQANQIGNYSLTMKASDGKATDTKVVNLTVTNNAAIDEWKKKYFGAADADKSANSADPDNDGCSNLVEYGLGLDPNKPDQEPTLIGVTTGTNGHSYLTLTYVKRTDDPNLTFRVLGGGSLRANAVWDEQTDRVENPSQEGVPAGFERVIVRDSVPIETGGPRRYLKLEVGTN